jgi:FixJ family two-component response regulator
MANKEIAHKLGTSERTVKAHRAQIMEKMNVGSLADLIRFAEKLKTRLKDL